MSFNTQSQSFTVKNQPSADPGSHILGYCVNHEEDFHGMNKHDRPFNENYEAQTGSESQPFNSKNKSLFVPDVIPYYKNIISEEDQKSINEWHKLNESEKLKHIEAVKGFANDGMGTFLIVLYDNGKDQISHLLGAIESELTHNFLGKRGLREVYLMLKMASFYFLMGETKKFDEWLEEAGKVIGWIDQCQESADCHRIFFLMKANYWLLEKGDLNQSLWCLDNCWEVSQEYFRLDTEDFLDFYAAIRGKISFVQKNLDEAEAFYLDALALRLRLGNNRLVSLSYADLAELYLERAKKQQSLKNKAKEYLNKGKEAYERFREKSGKNDNVNVGIVDYRVPDFEKIQNELDMLE